MNDGSVTWIDVLSAVSGSVAALLSIIAVFVTIYISRVASKQADMIAKGQEQHDRQVYAAERKKELLEHARSVLAAAHAIKTLANPRVSELFSESAMDAVDPTHLRVQLRTLLAQLGTEVNLLTRFRDAADGMGETPRLMIPELLEEAAWVYSDALHLAILCLTPECDREEIDLRNPQDVVDALLNGSAVNLEPRLLSGYNPDDVSGSSRAAHAEWQSAYDRRETLLLESHVLTSQPLSNSLAEVAARSLGWLTIRRFEDLTTKLLYSWGAVDAVEFRLNV